MRIIQQKEFFNIFNSKAMTVDQFLNSFDDKNQLQKTLDYIKASKFLQNKLRKQLKDLTYKQYLLAIVADWCGDCHRGIPILKHISDASELLEVRFLIKEENIDLIPPSNGSEKIPYVMFYSQDGLLISNWIERSQKLYKIVSDIYKKNNFVKDDNYNLEYKKALEKNMKKIFESIADELTDIIIKNESIQGSSTRLNSG